MFDVDETKLFFLFSCPELEQDEFVAMLDTRKEESLVSNYVQLFQGLKVDVAQKNIKDEIERTESGLLSFTPEEADARIREMAALYPHTDVYRRAMRYFILRRRADEASLFALRLLELIPQDSEAHLQVARFVLQEEFRISQGEFHLPPRSFATRAGRRLMEMLDAQRLVSILQHAYETGQLTITEKIKLADILEDLDKPEVSFVIVKKCLDTGEVDDPELRVKALGIAARTAMELGKKEEASQFVSELPVNSLRGGLAILAIQLKIDNDDKKGAYEVAKMILSRDLYPPVIETAVRLADELGRRKELEHLIRTHPGLRKGRVRDPEILMMLQRFGFDVSDALRQSFGSRVFE